MREIKLTRGQAALVDDEDFESLNAHKWTAAKTRYTWYAQRTVGPRGGQRLVLMHAVIAGTPKGSKTDHVDGNGLNNGRSNLRVCTTGQNQHNQIRKQEGRSSRFRGVHWSGGKWQATIACKGRSMYLGRFESEYSAAGAYDVAGIARDPEFFTPNFSASWLAPGS
jgi:hypothetical protein